jgi:hypothetical protein
MTNKHRKKEIYRRNSGEGKIVHGVFKYVSRSLLKKGVGAGGVTLSTSPPPYFKGTQD